MKSSTFGIKLILTDIMSEHVLVAQLDRASASEAEGLEFESQRAQSLYARLGKVTK